MYFLYLEPANSSVRLMSNLHIALKLYDSGWDHCDITQLPGCETLVGSILALPPPPPNCMGVAEAAQC